MARGGATVGALNVNLSIDSANFQTGLKKAEGNLSGFALKAQGIGKELGSLSSKLAGTMRMFGPLGAAASAAGLLEFARSTVSTTATLGDFADNLGVSAESLQRLRYAARQTGADADALDDGLRAMLGALADADEGAGGAGEEFKRLGINVRDANGSMKSADVVLLELADALKGAKTQSERAAIAAKILGEDGGPRLANLLAQGREAIEKLGEAAPVMSDAMVKAAQEADAEWAAFTNRLTVGAQNAILAMVRLAKAAAELSPVGMKLGRIREDIAKTEEMLSTRRAIDEGKLANLAGIPSAEFLERRLEALRKVRAEAEADPNRIVVPTVTPAGLPPLPDKPGSKGKGSREAKKTEAEKEAEAIARVVDALRFEGAQIDRTSQQRAAHAALQAAGIDADHESAAAVMELAAEVQRLQDVHADLDSAIGENPAFGFRPEKIKEVADEASKLREVVGDGLVESLDMLSRSFQGWEGLALHAVSRVIDKLLELQAVAEAGGKKGPLSDILGIATTAIGGLMGGGGSVIAPSTTTGSSSFGFGGLYASGGVPPVGQWSIVGEEGPELFKPGSTGAVIPNSQLGGIGGGDQTVHLSIAASEDFDVRVKQVSKGVAVDVVREKTPKIVQQSVKATYAANSEHRLT